MKDAGKREKMSLISENKPLQSQNYWNQPCRQVNKIGKNRRRLLMSRPAAWEGSKWWRSQKEAGKEGKASQIPIIKEQESPPPPPTPTLLHGTGRKHILQDEATAQHTDCPDSPLSETGKNKLALDSYSLPPDLTLLLS